MKRKRNEKIKHNTLKADGKTATEDIG